MADNYLERNREKYDELKVKWLNRKKHIRNAKKVCINTENEKDT
jgi:hypothetical protein